MTKHDQYNLSFQKVNFNNRIKHTAIRKKNTEDSFILLNLLTSLSLYESEGLLDEVISAINGQPFDPEFYINGSLAANDCTIVHPNALLGDFEYPFPLTELKLLLEEWIAFLKT